jgi:DNA-directed RNA polymerase subunit K/omega
MTEPQFPTQQSGKQLDVSSLSQGSKVLIGPPTLTRFELARVLGARALQLSMGAPTLVEQEPGEELSDPLLLARREVEAGALPISVRRMLPDRRFQDIPIRWLLSGLKARKAG